MSYICSEETEELIQAVKEFCDHEVREQSKEYDRSGEWPKEIYDKAMEMQLHMLEIPEEYGGLGLDKVSVAAILEEMAKADAGFALTFSVSSIGLKSVLMAGNEAQKKKYCDNIIGGHFSAFALTEPQAGSDAAAGKTTARKDGDFYVLNGRKTFITNGGVAGIYVVTAMTDKTKGLKGMSAFIVEAGTPGLSTGKHEDKMGIRGSNTCDVVFDECRIPAENLLGNEGDGFKIAMQTLDISRTFIGGMAVGIAQRAMEEAIAYAKTRIQFGQPIIKNQAIAFKLADMAIQIETARQIVANACTRMDMGLPYGKESAIAKCYGGDVAVKVTSEAVQIFGGYGYSREYPVEKLMRDAKIYQIFEGTNEIQRVVIANHLMKEY
ncbi:acyl-CoA dehydrogenase family protein [Frisingicoccus sp.]|uniref:acyl-CoA dehydrogenase family protein n=1 Tax=Frisingicoccus sp. TaxID=1918627 RepID=UPI0015BBED7A|nr:acyl-CoA dehydrogenase family protein [Frisingicoccus sp.]MEE0752993.1 acyl-CoA dehydrogenase family protein [Frisingicoccus sp.]